MYKQITNQELQSKVEFTPHQAQQDVIDNLDKEEIVLSFGRRAGKSILCAYLALGKLLGDNQQIWIVAPSYQLSMKIFNYLVKWINYAYPSLVPTISYKPVPQINIPAWGSWLECKSAGNPQNLLGEELDAIFIDEAAQIPKDIFESYLYPSLASREGKLFIVSSPGSIGVFGRNWFYDQFMNAKYSERGYARVAPSWENPNISKNWIEKAKQRLPDAIFKREIGGMFQENETGVFRNVEECIQGDFEEAKSGVRYIAGVDLAKLNDYTVITVMDSDRNHIVYFERFSSVDWKLQRTRIKNIARRYNNARLVVDASGVGDPFVDELKAEGFLVEPYRISGNVAKRQLVERLSMFLDNKSISYPKIDQLLDELHSYAVTVSEAGNVKYAAPEGFYDDCVMSLALVVQWLDATVDYMDPIEKELAKDSPKKTHRNDFV